MTTLEGSNRDSNLFRLYEANQERLGPVLASLRQLHAKPPEKVDYYTLAHTAQQSFGIPIAELTGERLRHVLYLLAREHGRIELHTSGCESGLEMPLDLAGGLRNSIYRVRPECGLEMTNEPAEVSVEMIVAEPKVTETAARRRRGVLPDMERHLAIAAIVSRHAPGGAWNGLVGWHVRCSAPFAPIWMPLANPMTACRWRLLRVGAAMPIRSIKTSSFGTGVTL